MRFFPTSTSFILGAILSSALLWNTAASADHPNLKDETASQQIRRLILDMDFPGTQKVLRQAHQASLNGDNDYSHLRAMFTVFQSTAPEMREFTESWLDEMPDSPYAQTALTWNLYTAGAYMRGENLSQFTYGGALNRFNSLHNRANRLARRAFKTAPDLVPASDAVIRLVLTNGSTQTVPPSGVKQQTSVLNKVMELTPNRGSLIRALSITQPRWRGSFDGAVELCAKFAGQVKNVEGYNLEMCLVDAAYTYGYGPEIKELAREVLNTVDYGYLDYARRQGWEPGLSRAMDRKILEYLQGKGATDYQLAMSYDQFVSEPQGLPLVGKAAYIARQQEARDKLVTDPFNPQLIETLTEPRFGALPGEDKRDRTDAIRLAKLALNAAPYDPDVWRNIALIYHSSNDPTDASENPFFENSMVFANHYPAYYFDYLSAKRADFLAIRKQLGAGQLSEQQIATVDEAVICPLIRLIRTKKLMCSAIVNDNIRYQDASCSWEPQNDGTLRELVLSAERRNSCTKEISSDPIDLFNLTPAETDVSLP